MQNEYFDKAIAYAGGQKSLAVLMRCHPTIVSKWRQRGVPAERVLAICRAVDCSVTPHELRPDIYPDPNWLPPLQEGAAYVTSKSY